MNDNLPEEVNQTTLPVVSTPVRKQPLKILTNSYNEEIVKARTQINILQTQLDKHNARIKELSGPHLPASVPVVPEQQNSIEPPVPLETSSPEQTKPNPATPTNQQIQNVPSAPDQLPAPEPSQESATPTVSSGPEVPNQLPTNIKEQLEQLQKEQQTTQSQLEIQQEQLNQLLKLILEEQIAYEAQTDANSPHIAELRRQQSLVDTNSNSTTRGLTTTSGGGYPSKWSKAPMDSVLDDWGMYNRQCVSYAAYRVAASGRRMPYWGGHGNADQWDSNAVAEGIAVDSSPRKGDVAQTDHGGLGHVMYVENVHNDGTISISQYNYDLDGQYSEDQISVVGLKFIHFT